MSDHSNSLRSTEEVGAALVREAMLCAPMPNAFFDAWKRGVKLAGIRFFGEGTQAGFELAAVKDDLRPNVHFIAKAIGPMSPGERKFLAALVSFYSPGSESAKLFKRAGIQGLADLGGLDSQRRAVIAALVVNYGGW